MSTPHLAMKFPNASGEIVEIRADLKIARQCYVDSLKFIKSKPTEEQVKNEGKSKEKREEQRKREEDVW